MKAAFRCLILASLFISTLYADPNSVVHCLRNGTPDKVAELITLTCDKKPDLSEVTQLYRLLGDHTKVTKINNAVEVCDLATLMLVDISGISASAGDLELKAIISHQSGNETVFRYHIFGLNKKESLTFKKKIKVWIQKTFPA